MAERDGSSTSSVPGGSEARQSRCQHQILDVYASATNIGDEKWPDIGLYLILLQIPYNHHGGIACKVRYPPYLPAYTSLYLRCNSLFLNKTRLGQGR